MTPEEVQGLVERLRAYNPPDRTIDEQRQIAVDIHEAAAALSRLAEENKELRDERDRLDSFHTDERTWRIHAETRLAAAEECLLRIVQGVDDPQYHAAQYFGGYEAVDARRSLTKAPHDKA